MEFFGVADLASQKGNYDAALSFYLQGLELDPANVAAHMALHTASLRRKARGGKSMGMWEHFRNRFIRRQAKEAMLWADRKLAFEPGNVFYMIELRGAALKAGFEPVAEWINTIIERATAK